MDTDQISEQYPAPVAKEPWEPPTIEQLDFASTEASFGAYGGVDFGIYAS